MLCHCRDVDVRCATRVEAIGGVGASKSVTFYCTTSLKGTNCGSSNLPSSVPGNPVTPRSRAGHSPP